MSILRTNEIKPVSAPGIGIGAPNIQPSALINIQSTEQGVALPRMTTAQRNAIVSPIEGLLVYNLDDGRLEQYTSGQWTVAGNGLSPVKNVLRVIKNTVLNENDFSSINDALASISDNSPTNQYSIEIGPGVFVENPIHMKPYVYVKGQDFDSTVIEANDPTEHLIFACEFSSISDCLLTGSTLSGKALIYYASTTGTLQTAFWAEDVRFGHADTLAIANGTLAHSNLFVNSCRWGGMYQFTTGFIAKSSGIPLGRIILRNSTSSKLSTPFPTDMFVVDGVGCELHLNSIISRTGEVGLGGTGIRVRNGGFLRILSADMDGWTKGLWVEDIGAACTVIGGVLTLVNNTIDVQVDPSTLTGGLIVADGDDTKIILNSALTNFGFISLSLENGNIVVSGKLEQIQPDGTFTDISTLASNSSPMGILSDGDITIPISGTTVTVTSGSGYLQKSDGSLRKIIWVDTPITLPNHSTNYLYFDENGVLQHNPVVPNFIQNIIVGRVVTNNGDILITEESGLLATHNSNNIGEALRKGLGPIYASGSTISETGTRNLTATTGSYFYGERNFLLNGGSPISFDTFYQDGSGDYVVTENDTQIDNTKWDDGTGTLASLTASYYAKHSLYALGDSTGDYDNEAYFTVYSQAEYSVLTLAQQGDLPTPPPYLSEAVVLIASIIVRQGTANIIEIRDERPRVGFKSSGVSAATFHSGLLGLIAPTDDHTQYIHIDGRRAMTGDLSLGTHNLTNIGTANGVTIENHHARHQTGGADAIPTVTTSIDGLMSASDKTKLDGIPASAVPTSRTIIAGAGLTGGGDLSTDRTLDVVANADGSIIVNANDIQVGILATDVQHGNRGGGGLHSVATTSVAGFISASDKTKLDTLLNEILVTQGAGLTANYSAGSVRINGTTYTLTASSITVATGATNGRIYVDVDGVVKSTTSTSTPANAVPLAIFSSSGAAITALSDNRTFINNNITFGASGDMTTITPSQSAAAGSTNKYADAGHTHSSATGTPSTISGNANTQGASSNIPRLDHTHQLTATTALNDHVPQFDGSNWQNVYPEALRNSSHAWMKFDDFFTGNNNSTNNNISGDLNWFFNKNGAGGTGDVSSTLVDGNHPGIIRLQSAAGGGNYVSMVLGFLALGGGALEIEYLIQLETLATVTNDYVIRLGLGDTVDADQVNGVYFEYNRATSANWLIRTANASTRTTTTTSTAVATGSWIKLHISINAAASSITYSINGSSVGTIATNIPTAVVQFFMHQTRAAGTPVGFNVDYFSAYQRFTSAR